MPYLYSARTGGFYIRGMHADIPADAVGVSDAEYGELMRAQAEGRRIVAEAGRPVHAAPASSALPPSVPAFSPLEFRRRFTDAERNRIALAANEAANNGDPTLLNWLLDLSAAPSVRMDAPEVAEGMQRLVELGLLSERRRDAIMGG